MKDVFCGVCPIRAGAGIQNKILNYLALGIPCVTSDVGLEGIHAVNGRDLLVYEQSDHAAELIWKLYQDASLRATIAKNGRRFVEGAHDWSEIHNGIRENVRDVYAGEALTTQ
jgi:glycosyltransferase involved in cell wall biosynthesis